MMDDYDTGNATLILDILTEHKGQVFSINNKTKNREIYDEMENLGLIKINKGLAGNCAVSYTELGLDLLG